MLDNHPYLSLLVVSLSIWLIRKWVAGGRNTAWPNLYGRYVIVTGANTGIGYQTALALARLGAFVTLACRDSEKSHRAVEEIREQSGNQNVVLLPLDLSDLHSIKSFADSYQSSGRPLHLLINNAGVMTVPGRRLTRQGFELQFGTNHLGHFYLTQLLTPLLVQSAPARVINVSSKAHERGVIDFENLNAEKEYHLLRAYQQSKLANVLHAQALNDRLAAQGVIAHALHPGVVRTELGRHLTSIHWLAKLIEWVLMPGMWLFMKNPWQGAQTTLWVALSESEHVLSGGKYWSDCRWKQNTNPALEDVALRDRLWSVSESMIEQALQQDDSEE